MGYYSGFKYGSGVLYGITCEITSVSPDSGPSTGGTRFVMTGDGFDPREWDDDFTDVLLTSKWSDLSAGGGSIYTGPDHLRMSTGATNSALAGVQSSAAWGDVQGEIRVILSTPVVFPISDVVVCRYSLWVDADNSAQMYITMDPQGALKLYCETRVGGIKSDELRSPLDWSLGLCTLKILRWGSDVHFIANGSVIWTTVKFVDSSASFRISSENLSQDYDIDTLKIEWFYFRPFAVFQNQPIHDTVIVSNKRARGLVPASRDIRFKRAAFKGLVDVSMVGTNTASVSDAYEYYFVDGLKAINVPQFATGLEIINDPQLETPAGDSKGLGGGY